MHNFSSPHLHNLVKSANTTNTVIVAKKEIPTIPKTFDEVLLSCLHDFAIFAKVVSLALILVSATSISMICSSGNPVNVLLWQRQDIKKIGLCPCPDDVVIGLLDDPVDDTPDVVDECGSVDIDGFVVKEVGGLVAEDTDVRDIALVVPMVEVTVLDDVVCMEGAVKFAVEVGFSVVDVVVGSTEEKAENVYERRVRRGFCVCWFVLI